MTVVLTIAMPVKHGGRRHGLREKGPAPRLKVSLSEEEEAILAALAEEWGVPKAEVIRLLIQRAKADRKPG